MSNIRALGAYRNALRATRVAFKTDLPVLMAARTQIKQGFVDNKDLADQEQQHEAIDKMNEVSQFLIKNIVQGEKQEGDKYFLNFHERTELGDNETIKQSKAEMGSLAGARVKKCSDIKKRYD